MMHRASHSWDDPDCMLQQSRCSAQCGNCLAVHVRNPSCVQLSLVISMLPSAGQCLKLTLNLLLTVRTSPAAQHACSAGTAFVASIAAAKHDVDNAS